MEDNRGFHGIYQWKLQLIEAMEASAYIENRNLHVRPWELSQTPTEMHLLPLTSMEIFYRRLPGGVSMEAKILGRKKRYFHGGRSYRGGRCKCPWK